MNDEDVKIIQHSKKISVLIADDSLVFRRFLRDIFENSPGIEIVGEARDGIEALELVLEESPDVILMDLEMPVMDGMTALQHLMIHRPTPTIMFSSLTNEGTARCFDTLKNGAVDFICKDFLFQEKNIELYRQTVLRKVFCAADNRVRSIEPMFSLSDGQRTNQGNQVIFCEECGTRQIIESEADLTKTQIRCKQCGDIIEIRSHHEKFRRNNFITILAGGQGCFRNLLSIVPRLDADMGGSLIAVIYEKEAAVDSFTEYLNAICSMKVIRARENMSVDGGNCYVIAGGESFGLKPFTANYSFQQAEAHEGVGGLDLMLASAAKVFKNRTAAVILSGDTLTGVEGVKTVVAMSGSALMLDPAECYCKEMGKQVRKYCPSIKILDEDELVARVEDLHYRSKMTVSAD